MQYSASSSPLNQVQKFPHQLRQRSDAVLHSGLQEIIFHGFFFFFRTEPLTNAPSRRTKERWNIAKSGLWSFETKGRTFEEIERLRHRHSICISINKNGFYILDSSTMKSLKVTREVGFGGMEKVSKVVKEDKCALKEMNVRQTSVSQQRLFIGEYEKNKHAWSP